MLRTLAAHERALNIALGASLLFWAAMGAIGTDFGRGPAAVRLGVIALNAIIGACFLVRKPAHSHGSWASVVMSVPAFAIAAAAFKLSAGTALWPAGASALFVAGAALACLSFVYLGRCFAIFPAFRGVVARGPYRLVRHPAYMGELMMVAACLWAAPGVIAGALGALIVPAIYTRIRVEEALLAESRDYRDYAGAVRWRLVPLVW